MANAIRIRIRADDDTHGFAAIRSSARNLGRSLRESFMAAGQQAGAAFQQTLSNVISQGMGNPIVASAVAGLALAAGSLLGSLLAGAIVLGFGAAFVGLGVYLLKDREDVKAKWGETLDGLKKQFADAATPLLPVLEKARLKLGELGTMFAPQFRQAMEDSAPFLEDFLDVIAKGFESLGETAFKPMMNAFNLLLEELGPQFESFFNELGDALSDLAGIVIEYKAEIALAFGLMLQLIPLAIRIVGGLAATWGELIRALQRVVGWVSTLWGWVNRNWSRRVAFAMPGVATAIRLVKDLWGWVNRNWSRSITLSFQSIGLSAIQSAISALPGFAHGGIRGAASGGPRGGLTMVGEHGPELVNLTAGSRVRSNSDTRRIMGQQGSAGGRTVIEINSGGSRMDDLILEIIRKSVRIKGGNVQLVLGGS